MDDVTWEDLNPARGDQSPRAGTLWGDRKGPPATGYLLRPVDGFRSPPHIHNVTYRAVVLRGVLHNDDENAADMWMPAGSFWTQPKGQPHITAAKGADTLAYIEIDEGPYLVHPVDQAFATDEHPVNVHVSNVVWVPVDDVATAHVSHLWGAPSSSAPHGLFVKLAAHSDAIVHHQGAELRVVVVTGTSQLALPDGAPQAALAPGSLVSSTGEGVHPLKCGDEDCVFYVRATGPLDVTRP